MAVASGDRSVGVTGDVQSSVIVTGGPNVGKKGWVKEVDLY